MHEAFFTENNFVGRGISGQVTAQMLVRFRPDVLNLHPKVVVILAGTNDIARNDKYVPVEHIAGSVRDLANARNKCDGSIPVYRIDGKGFVISRSCQIEF